MLGEGGMGRVYSGEQQMGTSVRRVAVKTLLAQYAKDKQVVDRFKRECGLVSELEHPNTIKVYDYGQTDTGDLYIAMELLTGVSLEKALEGGPLSPERVDRIVSQIAGSLQEAHEKGIVHRDLKPANIYLTTRAGEEDYVKVLDFGIAKRDEKHGKQEQKLTQMGTVLGTPPYMSPEQFRGQELDATSDIYSLGVMTYEMLTGRLPFDADTPWAWATQHMTAQPFPFETIPLGSQVPGKMKAAVMRALSKDKLHRHQSVRDFYEDFTMGWGRASSTVSRPSIVEGAAPAGGPGAPVTMGIGPQGPVPLGGIPLGNAAYANPPFPTTGAMNVASPFSGSAASLGGGPPQLDPAMGSGLLPGGGTQAVAPESRRSGIPVALAIVAALALLSGSAVGAYYYFGRPHANGPRPPATSKTAAPRPPTVPPTDTDTGVDTGVDVGRPTPFRHVDEECRHSHAAADQGNIALAVDHFQRCVDSAGKGQARMAIEQAAIRKVDQIGCQAWDDARLAHSVGAGQALDKLVRKHCAPPHPGAPHHVL
jgi:serine/threonine-protein kinase